MRTSSGITYPRVEPGVAEIDQEVHQHEYHDDEHHQRLGHGVVIVDDGLDEELAEPVQVEYLLGDDQPAHEKCEFDADDGDHRQQRVLERMTLDVELLTEA